MQKLHANLFLLAKIIFILIYQKVIKLANMNYLLLVKAI